MTRTRLRLLYLAYGLSGMAALADEVVWTRYLHLVLGSSVYAVAAMLSAYMSGLALGGVLGARYGDRIANPLRAIIALELGIGATALLTLLLLQPLTDLHLWAYQRFQLQPILYFSLDALLALPLVLVPTTLMGATFPLITRVAAGGSGEQVARVTGTAYAANTFGAIVGSAAAGFVAIPFLGLRGALIAAASLNLIAALLVALSGDRKLRARTAAGSVAVLVVLAALVPEPAAPVGYYVAGRAIADPSFPGRLAAMETVYRRWAPEGLVEVRQGPGGVKVLIVDGRIEGGSRTTETTTQDLLALAPAAARGKREKVFLIGLGIGRTFDTHRGLFPAAELEVAEVNPGVVEAVSRFFLPGAELPITVGDGRGLLKRGGEPYDAIISGPSFPVDTTSGNLFTLEFFQLVRSRLAEDGVFVGWMPGYLLDGMQERILMATVAEALPHLRLLRLTRNDDLIIVASPSLLPTSLEMIQRLATAVDPFWSQGVVEIRLDDDAQLADYLAELGPDPRLNRDEDPWLEFTMARNLVRGRSWLRE
ncbi:MAG: fused MFS/spermidine synthase [Deltaproteobacteria bacterium]|nr:fused MFS/spermidine synthase [Deltaproteobacteria bacterium]